MQESLRSLKCQLGLHEVHKQLAFLYKFFHSLNIHPKLLSGLKSNALISRLEFPLFSPFLRMFLWLVWILLQRGGFGFNLLSFLPLGRNIPSFLKTDRTYLCDPMCSKQQWHNFPVPSIATSLSKEILLLPLHAHNKKKPLLCSEHLPNKPRIVELSPSHPLYSFYQEYSEFR